jgi:hypothetical protein
MASYSKKKLTIAEKKLPGNSVRHLSASKRIPWKTTLVKIKDTYGRQEW